jgi:hypothetical protein
VIEHLPHISPRPKTSVACVMEVDMLHGETYPWSPRRIIEHSVSNPIRDAAIEIHGMVCGSKPIHPRG